MDLGGGDGFAPSGSDGDGGDLTSSPRDGWESVAPAPLFLASEDQGRGWEMVVPGRRALAYDDGCSVFPPCEHEGLLVEESFTAAPEGGGATGNGENDPPSMPLSPPFSSASASSSSSSSSSRSSSFSFFVSSSGGGGKAWRTVRCEWAKRSFVELARRAVRSGYDLLYLTLRRQRVGRGFDGVKHGVVWSSAAVAGLAALLLLSIRRRYQREKLRLILLIQEKDQKISQLLLQIAQMNEILSSHRRVSVLKIA